MTVGQKSLDLHWKLKCPKAVKIPCKGQVTKKSSDSLSRHLAREWVQEFQVAVNTNLDHGVSVTQLCATSKESYKGTT